MSDTPLRTPPTTPRKRLKQFKRFVFRRGYLPMSDVHDILERASGRIKPFESGMMDKYIFSRSPKTKTEFDEYFQIYKTNWDERFLQIFGEESAKQWDRIVDRRTSAWFYGLVLNVVVAFVVGVVVGKLLL